MRKVQHNKPNQINIYELDTQSDCTGNGNHEKVMARCPDAGKFTCDVVKQYGLPLPTVQEILRAAKRRNGSYQLGKWKVASVEEWTNPNNKLEIISYNFIAA